MLTIAIYRFPLIVVSAIRGEKWIFRDRKKMVQDYHIHFNKVRLHAILFQVTHSSQFFITSAALKQDKV